jgi:hypothetical protein
VAHNKTFEPCEKCLVLVSVDTIDINIVVTVVTISMVDPPRKMYDRSSEPGIVVKQKVTRLTMN